MPRTTRALALVPAALLACVFGYRSEAAVTATYPLAGVDTVRVELPRTPITVVGDPMATGLELTGAWRSVGGTAEVAKDNARTPRLVFAADGGFGLLSAVIPLAVHGQIDLELEEIRLPPDRDLELSTALGDISVIDVAGNIGVDVDAGHVDIRGGAGGIAVRTGIGDLDIETTGHVDAHTARGGAEIVQAGAGGNDIVVTARGDVRVALASDANLDLDLRGAEIRVETRTVSTITRGAFRRTTGGGSVKIWIDAGPGAVTVRLADAP